VPRVEPERPVELHGRLVRAADRQE
jgi:hypothetical protein